MEPVSFCRTLFDFLEDFDGSIPPLGLYACEDLPRDERDRAKDPFAKELGQLKQSTPWESHGVVYETRVLADQYGRDFRTRLSAWARLA